MALSVKSSLGGGSIGAVENLLVPTLGTTTQNGVTCTANGDGTYTLNGTATANTLFHLCDYFKLQEGNAYKLCGCPKGGSGTTYRLRTYHKSIADYNDIGDGVVFDGQANELMITMVVMSGTTVNNLIFKPMLTTNLKATYKEFVKRVGGFNNLLNPTLATRTESGVTCTNNGDGTYTLNGHNDLPSSRIFFFLQESYPFESGKVYKLTGCPKGGSTTTYQLGLSGISGSGDNGNGFIYTSDGVKRDIMVAVGVGATLNNVTFKPMITESLLPEYYDFVKGVEDIKAMLGCTKVAVSEYTPTSDTVISTSTSSPTMINHALGQKPTFVAMISDVQLTATKYLISCVFHRNSNNNNNVAWGNQICGNSVYGNIGLYLIGSKLSTTQIALQTTTSSVYLKGGATYKIIAMA